MKIVDRHLFSELQAKAAASPRGRAHYNLHPTVEADIHCLVMAVQPPSYVRPHRHVQPDKWELMVILHGAVSVLTFSAAGEVTGRYDLEADGDQVAVELPENGLHCFVVRRPDSAVIEVKRGPYQPLSEADFAPWAPPENAPDAPAFLEKLKQAKPGDNMAAGLAGE